MSIISLFFLRIFNRFYQLVIKVDFFLSSLCVRFLISHSVSQYSIYGPKFAIKVIVDLTYLVMIFSKVVAIGYNKFFTFGDPKTREKKQQQTNICCRKKKQFETLKLDQFERLLLISVMDIVQH